MLCFSFSWLTESGEKAWLFPPAKIIILLLWADQCTTSDAWTLSPLSLTDDVLYFWSSTLNCILHTSSIQFYTLVTSLFSNSLKLSVSQKHEPHFSQDFRNKRWSQSLVSHIAVLSFSSPLNCDWRTNMFPFKTRGAFTQGSPAYTRAQSNIRPKIGFLIRHRS